MTLHAGEGARDTGGYILSKAASILGYSEMWPLLIFLATLGSPMDDWNSESSVY